MKAFRRVAAGEPLREIALSYAVDHSTISRLKAQHAAEIDLPPGVETPDVRESAKPARNRLRARGSIFKFLDAAAAFV